MAEKKSQKKPADAPAKKPAAKKSDAQATSGGAAPLIDTSRAANAAAAMVGGKVSLPSSATGGEKKESAAFKQMKAGLNKPSAGALGGVFGNVGPQKKSHQTHGGPKQVGQNQTYGADVTRTGVPRRTPG